MANITALFNENTSVKFTHVKKVLVNAQEYTFYNTKSIDLCKVLNFFQASLRNCKNCDHNCEDHSSFDLTKSYVEICF